MKPAATPPLSLDEFVAIDFETASADRASACSIGIALYGNGRLTTREYLIRPPELRFDRRNIAVHGITPEMVRNAPTFIELFPRIRDYLEAASIWAHYAPFDQGVLNALARHYRVALPIALECTCRLSRRLYPGLPSHSLPIVCGHLGITLTHHNARSDAEACARIVLASQGTGQPDCTSD